MGLTSPEKRAHNILRHFADYVLIWCGQGGDLSKSPHMARIGNSVYSDICPGDPTCSKFQYDPYTDTAPPMMAESLLYKLHENEKQGKGQLVNASLFQEVYRSKYDMVRIFKVKKVSKESKAWLADPANRKCDAPGSWYCPGQYPPALDKLFEKKKDFAQREDINKKRSKEDEQYQKEYHERMAQFERGGYSR